MIGCPVCGGEAVAVGDQRVRAGVVGSRRHSRQDLSVAAGSSQVECGAALNVFSRDCGIVGQQRRHAVLPAEQRLQGGKNGALVRRTGEKMKRLVHVVLDT